MKQRMLQHVIRISNPDASKNSGVVVLDLDSEEMAVEVARKLAFATGREVNLLDGRLTLIKTIPAATIH
jgi:hypothetical protein